MKRRSAKGVASPAAAPRPWAALFVVGSLVVNVAVLVPVCLSLSAYGGSEPVVYAWGPPTAGRGILLSIYFAILVASVLLLGLKASCAGAGEAAVEHMAAALLATQVLYKVTTPATAGASNPVAISNLAISAVHATSLYLLWRKHAAAR